VNHQVGRIKPTRKPALETRYAIPAAAAILIPILAAFFGLLGELSGVVLYAIPGAAALVAIFRALFKERELPPVAGRRLELSDGRLRQYDDKEVVAEIDATQDFEYRVLDRYDVKRALFRLYQADRRLTFYVSDPGGEDVVKTVVQIDWPPRSRHIGRSYPPTAA
jgi:hypothetical protein